MTTVLTHEQKEERAGLALEATWEIESIAGLLQRELPTEADSMYLKSLVRRLQELNSAAMSLLGEADFPTETLRKTIQI